VRHASTLLQPSSPPAQTLDPAPAPRTHGRTRTIAALAGTAALGAAAAAAAYTAFRCDNDETDPGDGRPCVIALDVGTLGDNRMMEMALSQVRRCHDIVYITDRKHKVPEGDIRIAFSTPPEILEDTNTPMADTSKSTTAIALQHGRTLAKVMHFRRCLIQTIQRAVKRYDVKAILVLYPALFVAFGLTSDVFDRVPVVCLWYAPGYPNTSIPWLYDASWKDENEGIYKGDPRGTGLEVIKRFEMARASPKKDHVAGAIKIFKRFQHVACWAQSATRPIHMIEDIPVERVGGLYNKTQMVSQDWYGPGQPSDELLAFIRRKGNTALVAFGSYADSPALKPIIPMVVKELTRRKWNVIIHNTKKLTDLPTGENILIHSGWLPYEYIAPHCQLAVFTGSAVLQTVCLYNKVPMLFVPLLSEQFYFAKNYQDLTHTPYINHQIDLEVNRERVQVALDTFDWPSVLGYLQSVHADLVKNHGPTKICRFVQKLIRENAKDPAPIADSCCD
jgi:hypothetical protein